MRVETKTRIIWPNSWGSVNETEFLRNEKDLDYLLQEISPAAFGDALLKNTYHRRDVFNESNVRLSRVLAYQIIVQTYPKSWLFK